MFLLNKQSEAGLARGFVVRHVDVLETFKLPVLNLHLVLAIVVYVEYIDDRIGTTHEVRMVRVDVSILDFYEILNHCISRLKLLVQQVIHHLDNLFAQILEPLQFWHLYFCHDSSQFLKYELHALKRGRF